MNKLGSLLITGVLAQAGVAAAADFRLSIEIPRLDVAEYHRPYVAVWIEHPDHRFAANLAVWYDTGLANNEGETWLKDLRQWWRRSGRSLDMPVDGVSGPTRPPGTHRVEIAADDSVLAGFAAGEYVLVVEASREVGGRELLKIPFTWGEQPVEADVEGDSELGRIHLSIQ